MVGLLCSLHARRYARAAEDHRAAASQIVPEKGLWRHPSMVAQLVVRAGGRERGRKRAERMCRTEPTEPTERMMWRGTLVLRCGKLNGLTLCEVQVFARSWRASIPGVQDLMHVQLWRDDQRVLVISSGSWVNDT